MHLTLDGFGANKERLQDLDFLFTLLDLYPSQIGMTKIMPPYVFKYHGVKPEDWGLSGFVLIAESHISIHTFPERGYINIDVFSCKTFDADAAVDFMKEQFGLSHVNTRVLERGLEYPHEIPSATQLVRAERLEVALAYPAGHPST
ncbi:MAG: adenosylmethionine decarboxylase [Chloroflexi bacterium]|nr:adenosylmethionine decarboxylase [Chloroflexota bacterium]